MDATRRHLTHTLLPPAATLGILRLAFGSGAFAAPVQPLTESWARNVADLAQDFRQRSLSPQQWQQAVSDLNTTVPIHELLSYIDFERISTVLKRRGAGEHFERVRLPALENGGARIWSAIFILPEGDAIPPHAHNNLATAHLVLQGRFRARTFDRLQDEPGRMLLRPHREQSFGVGETVSMSNDSENAHWFIAEKGPVFILDISIRSPVLRQYQNPTDRDGRIFVAPADRRDPDGLVEATVISHDASVARYGRATEFLKYR